MSLYFFKSDRDDDDDDEVAGQLICKLPLHDLYTQLPWLYNLNGNFYEDDFSKRKILCVYKNYCRSKSEWWCWTNNVWAQNMTMKEEEI